VKLFDNSEEQCVNIDHIMLSWIEADNSDQMGVISALAARVASQTC
jgi:hypothetical protein